MTRKLTQDRQHDEPELGARDVHGATGPEQDEAGVPPQAALIRSRYWSESGHYAAIFDPLALLVGGQTTLVLAESIEPNADAIRWTIRLHEGVTFHDGKSMTSADAIYSLRRAASDPESSATPSSRSFSAGRGTPPRLASRCTPSSPRSTTPRSARRSGWRQTARNLSTPRWPASARSATTSSARACRVTTPISRNANTTRTGRARRCAALARSPCRSGRRTPARASWTASRSTSSSSRPSG